METVIHIHGQLSATVTTGRPCQVVLFLLFLNILTCKNTLPSRLKGVNVTHIWTQDRKISRHVAAAALIKILLMIPAI